MNRNSKRKRKRLLGFMMVLFILPLLVVGGCSLVGEGLTFEAIRARIGAKNAFESMLKGDYEDVASYIDFSGLSEDASIISQSIIEGERERFVQGLEDFFSIKNRAMTGYDIVTFSTDDGYTIGTVCVFIQEGDAEYNLAIRLSQQDGQLLPLDVPSIMTEGSNHEEGRALADEFIEVIRTHNSG